MASGVELEEDPPTAPPLDEVVFRFRLAMNSSVALSKPADSDVIRRTGFSPGVAPRPLASTSIPPCTDPGGPPTLGPLASKGLLGDDPC